MIMMLGKTARASMCYVGHKEGLTEEAGFPIVKVTRAKARVVAGRDLTTEVTDPPASPEGEADGGQGSQSEIILVVGEAAANRLSEEICRLAAGDLVLVKL